MTTLVSTKAKGTFCAVLVAAAAAVFSLATGASGFAYAGVAEEVRTYQAKFNATFFPESEPKPPGVETFVVVYVIKGTFEPQSFATMGIHSYFEPQAFGICEPRPFLIHTLEHAEVSFNSKMVLSSTEPLPLVEGVDSLPPFAGMIGTTVPGRQLHPENDTITYLLCDGRIFADNPTEMVAEPVTSAMQQAGSTFYRIPNYEECPELGLDP